jgi:hypothetical protein
VHQVFDNLVLGLFKFSSSCISHNISLFILYFSVYQTAVLLWLPDPATRDAEIIRKSLVLDRNLEAATEVICSRTPSQLQYLKQLYHSKFGVYVEQEIELNTSGDHKKVRFIYVPSLVLVCGITN